jgi:hypothetical protein
MTDSFAGGSVVSMLKYIQYRPLYRYLFLFRPKFYKAFYCTYLEKYFAKKAPFIDENTFLVWEPCSKSHGEVVPGYVKYLSDLGYKVSVLVSPTRYKEGLFSRFDDENVFYNNMSQKEIHKYFKNNTLKNAKGILVTTVGKLSNGEDYDDAYNTFKKDNDKQKILLVEHEIKHTFDYNTLKEEIITLRQVDYKDAKTVVINPHYFGAVNITPKNETTNFVSVGAIRAKKKNNQLIIDSVKELHNKDITNFKVTVIGKGNLSGVPKEIKKYFDIKGRLNFADMYKEIEKADFFLTSYNKDEERHIRYITTGTSGNFQLIYGFAKPCLIIKSFAPINGLDDKNSIVYDKNSDYAEAMQKAIEMTQDEYKIMQNNLKDYADKLYRVSLENMRRLINE